MDRFPGWTTEDDRMANAERTPAEVWHEAVSRLDTETDALASEAVRSCHRTGTDDPEMAARMVALVAKVAALRAELAQLLMDA